MLHQLLFTTFLQSHPLWPVFQLQLTSLVMLHKPMIKINALLFRKLILFHYKTYLTEGILTGNGHHNMIYQFVEAVFPWALLVSSSSCLSSLNCISCSPKYLLKQNRHQLFPRRRLSLFFSMNCTLRFMTNGHETYSVNFPSDTILH